MCTGNSRNWASDLERKRNYPTFQWLIWKKAITETLSFNRETKSLSLFLNAPLFDLLKVKLIFSWRRRKCLLGTANTRLTLKKKYFFKKLKIKNLYMILFSLIKYKQNCVVYIWYYSLGISTGSFFSLPSACRLFSRGWFSRALAFRLFFYPWGKMGTTRSLRQGRQLVDFAGFRDFNNCSSDLIMIYSSHFFNSSLWSWIAFLPIWLRPCWINIKFLKTSSPALATSSTSIQLTKRCKSDVINCLSSLAP